MDGREPVASRWPRPEQIVLFSVGGLLCVSGCFHVLVWLADGGSLEGSISWRKPILFGFSAGVTVLSVGWVAGKMKRRTIDLLLLPLFGIAMLAEVGLITLQQWRGVASHFNHATAFDATVLTWIEWLILFATLVIAEITRRSFQPLSSTPDMTLAIRSGMGLLLLSCLLGFSTAAYGNYRVSQGLSPEIYPPAGVMKFPHGVPMHAIQYLPVLAWFLRALDVLEHQRYRAVACALSSALLFTVFSLLQTFTGKARFDVGWLSGFLLIASAVLITIPVYIGLSRATRQLLCREMRL